jgi:hypothetical protein
MRRGSYRVPDTDAVDGRPIAEQEPGRFRQARDPVGVRDDASTQVRGEYQTREETAVNYSNHGFSSPSDRRSSCEPQRLRGPFEAPGFDAKPYHGPIEGRCGSSAAARWAARLGASLDGEGPCDVLRLLGH